MSEYRQFLYILVMALLLALWSYSAHSTQSWTSVPTVAAPGAQVAQAGDGALSNFNSL